MLASPQNVAGVFNHGGATHYLLPHFQRKYVWGKENWDTLLTDIFAVYDEYSADNEPEHFMGSLVVMPDTAGSGGPMAILKLVDGQQRLTTISLLLMALSRTASDNLELSTEIQGYLLNAGKSGDLRYKILPTTKDGDRASYQAILSGEDVPECKSNIPVAYTYLKEKLSQEITKRSAEAEKEAIEPQKLFNIIVTCLQVVYTNLRYDEKPYKIFESLNAKGKPLTQGDLVRNYIAMKLPAASQQEVFDKYWSKIDALLPEEDTAGMGELTAFIRHYLAMNMGALPNQGHVYARFRDRMEKEFSAPEPFIEELKRLQRYAEHYDKLLRPEHEPRPDVREAVRRLNTLEAATAYPFLIKLYAAEASGAISSAQFTQALAIVENYLVRRFLAGRPTNYLTRMFPALWHGKGFEDFPQSLKEALVTKDYPTVSRVRQGIYSRDFYKGQNTRQKTVLVLESVNRHLSLGLGGYTTLDDRATVEHILPQTASEEWSEQWQEELGPDWKPVYDDYVNTLGNLTLLTQAGELGNSSSSNKPFDFKKSNLKKHALKLNSDYFSNDIPQWNREAIRERADFLFARINERWPLFAEPPAPPSQERQPRATSTAPGENALSPRQQLQLEYWTEFARYLEHSDTPLRARTPLAQHWMSFASGRSHFDMPAFLSTGENHIGVGLVVSGPDRLSLFQRVFADRTAIEAELIPGEDIMEWNELPEKKLSRIYLIHPDTDPADRERWPEQHQWLREKLEAFRRIFTPRLKSLD